MNMHCALHDRVQALAYIRSRIAWRASSHPVPSNEAPRISLLSPSLTNGMTSPRCSPCSGWPSRGLRLPSPQPATLARGPSRPAIPKRQRLIDLVHHASLLDVL